MNDANSMDVKPLNHFRFWCQKVLPLVYDDSLSYYEVLCKVVNYINNLIDTNNQIIEYVDELKAELKVVQDWIDNFDTSYAESIIREYLATMIFVEISDAGYFVYYREIKQNCQQESSIRIETHKKSTKKHHRHRKKQKEMV